MGYPPPPPSGGPGGYPPPPPGSGYGVPQGYPQTAPGGYSPAPTGGRGGSKGPLIALMAALVVVVLLVVVGGLALALGGGEDTVELTQAQRQDALLTEGDVGGGFTESGPDDTPDESGGDDPDASGACEDLIDELDEAGQNPFSTDDDTSADERTFVAESGATLVHSVGPDDDLLDRYRDVVEVCDELSFTDPSGEGTILLAEGDDLDGAEDLYVVDVEFSYEGNDGTSLDYEGRIAIGTYRGNALFLLATDGFDFSGSEPGAVPFDERLFEDVAAAADEKLRDVVDDV